MKTREHNDAISVELEKTCAQEKIHLLGTVQPYGFMMVADLRTGRLVQVSSGIAGHWPGLPDPAALIGAPVTEWVDGIDAEETTGLACLPNAYPQNMPWRPRFERTGAAPAAGAPSLWECLGHRMQHLAILEWLPLGDDADEYRKQNRTFGEITRAINRLRHANRLDTFFGDCVQVVQSFSGFDRVMIYRFLPDGCGEVMAEHTAPAYPQRFIGLRFPASDIPSQARTLYLTNRLRVLADVEAEPDLLVPATLDDGMPLDQSHCFLRGLSPVHLSYLRNMGVRATLTLSIICDDKLWGLIACHHHSPRVPPHQVRDGLRQICELIAEVTMMRIESLSQMEAVRTRLSLDQLLNQLHQSLMHGRDIPSGLEARLPDLLTAFQADCLGVKVGSIVYVAGPGRRRGKAGDVVAAVEARLDTRDLSPRVQMWDDLLAPGRPRLASLPEAAGMLLAQRNEDEPNFCFVTRSEVVQQVRWAGRPDKQVVEAENGMVRLEPRRSFAVWQHALQGHSQSWKQVEADALKTLLQIVMEVHKLHLNRQLQQKLHWRAHHDQLTGLYNRRAMEDEVSRRLEVGQFNCVLLLLDMDNFKKINDTYGHGTGDHVLQQLSNRIGTLVRDTDLFARLGGDEFMLMLQVMRPDTAIALALAERVHQVVAPPFKIDDQELRIGISIGIAIPPEHGRTVEDLLRRADLALYHAKALGRSRSVVFEGMMESDRLAYYVLERDLNDAVEREQLSLVFQPKVDLLTCRVVSLEALVRWNHPTRGQSLPGMFIPVAERSDQIVRIDRWVLRAAVAAQARWLAQGRPQLPVAVNLSMADILSSNLIGYLRDLLEEFHVPAAAIEIEVTESSMMGDLEKTKSVLQLLNEHGITTTLDDFGTGFSSLSYLRQLPLQCLKIDQSFIRSMLEDPNAEKLTQTILAMGLALEMQIVAEGVETLQQLRWLVAHGCPIGQGDYFSVPVAAEDLPAAIRRIELRQD